MIVLEATDQLWFSHDERRVCVGTTDDEITERKFDSLKKLAGKNFPKFAVAFDQVSAEVQMKLIEQLPEFRKLAKDAVDSISKAYESTLKSDNHSEDKVHEAYGEWRASLNSMLADPDLTLDEKLKITAQIGETVRAQDAKVSEGRRMKMEMFRTVALVVVAVPVVLVAAIVGAKAMVDEVGSDEA